MAVYKFGTSDSFLLLKWCMLIFVIVWFIWIYAWTIRDLSRTDSPIYDVKAHKSCLNVMDGCGGQNIGALSCVALIMVYRYCGGDLDTCVNVVLVPATIHVDGNHARKSMDVHDEFHTPIQSIHAICLRIFYRCARPRLWSVRVSHRRPRR